MPALFRAIIKKRNKWLWDEPRLPWLAEDDIPAGPLEHLIPEDHKVSVFVVNNDRARMDRVATAIVAGRMEFSPLEFIVFDEAVLNEVGIEVDKTAPGDTYDPEVNTWHYDLINVSANQLVALVKRILPITGSDLVLEKQVRRVFAETIAAHRSNINWAAVHPKIRKEYQKELSENQG